MPDPFANYAVSLTSPAQRAEPITPSNGAELASATRAIYVGQTGNVRLRTVGGDIVTLANMQGGVLYPIRADQVLATGTTASDIVGLS